MQPGAIIAFGFTIGYLAERPAEVVFADQALPKYIRRMELVGEAAGLATAFLWALTSIFFAEAGRRIGSFRVNVIRLGLAVAIYVVVLLISQGRLFPDDLNRTQVLWLTGSALAGLVFGDGCGFKALVMIGPRLTTLMYAGAPIWTTVIAWIFLGEHLGAWHLLGIALSIGGIVWVVLERRYKGGATFGLTADHPDSGSLFKGVMLGLGAAVGQAVGLVMAKQGMFNAGGTVEPMDAAFLRMLTAFPAIVLLAGLRGRLKEIGPAIRDLGAVGWSTAGATMGPFLGVWMSLVAVKYIATGIAATLNAMTPVAVLPLVIWYYKEKVTLRAALGALVAVTGAAILFLA
jgi:drug/metabolite transporter (DMT)-like permease